MVYHTIMEDNDIMSPGSEAEMIKKVMRATLRRSVGQLARHMKKRYKEVYQNEYGSKAKPELEDIIGDISNWYAEEGMAETKRILEERYGFSKNDLNKGLVWTPGNNKGRKPTVHLRGSIKDSIDYEFYGVPQGTLPNLTRLRNWVRTRVVLRDAGLRRQYQSPGRKHKTDMLDDLTWKFAVTIRDHGLKRRSTTRFEPTQDPKLLEQGISVTYKGKNVPVKQLTKKEALTERENI